MSEEWTDWIEHDASGCPIAVGMYCAVTCRGRSGKERTLEGVMSPKGQRAGSWTVKDHLGLWDQVIRYRIRKPRALLQLIEMVENLPAPAQPRVDA